MMQAEARRVQQTGIVRTVDTLASKAWDSLDTQNLSGSFAAGVGQLLLRILSAGQLAAATGASEYVAQVAPDPVGAVRPGAFAGVASDGRSLASLLYLPVIRVKQRIGRGMDIADAMDTGLRELLLIAGTQVFDAGRVADSVAMTATTEIVGYTRYLVPPSCSRCTVLAGQVYRHSTGFQRHPRCDCQMRPITKSEWDKHRTDVTNNPRKAFDALTTKAQDDLYGKAGAMAIRDGADMGKVVNARRGMYTASGRSLTTEGIRARRGGVRLMPEQIYREAGENRDEAIRLLKRFGYLT